MLNKSIEIVIEKISNIKGLSRKKSIPISESIVYISLLILRGMNKNPDFLNSGSIPVSWFQSKHKISRSLCAEILDICFIRSEEYRTGVCKSSKLQPWLKDFILEYICQTVEIGTIYQAGENKKYQPGELFTIKYSLPLNNLKEASQYAKRMSVEDECHEWGKDVGKPKNNHNEYLLAHLYLESAIKRNGEICENYRYSECGRPYQLNFGFQNMKRNIRNIVFKDFYMVDINSSFFRMAYELYHNQWNDELKNEIFNIINNKDEYFKDFINDNNKYQEFKISLISCLLGTKDDFFISLNPQTYKLYKLLNEWLSPQKRRLIANSLFQREQEHVSNLINQINEIPHVLIHDGFIIKNNYSLDEKIWSIKKI